MGRETARQRVRIDGEDFVERIDGEPARFDAVVALKYGARYEMGAIIQPRKPVRLLERAQALRLGKASGGCGGADAKDEHGSGHCCEGLAYGVTVLVQACLR